MNYRFFKRTLKKHLPPHIIFYRIFMMDNIVECRTALTWRRSGFNVEQFYELNVEEIKFYTL